MKSILAIDDDRELCGLLRQYFEKEDFALECAHDGAQGLDLLSRGRYHLVILDVMLPGMDGFEVLRRIRGDSRVPVVMLTAKGDPIDRVVGLEIGADDYICKPFNVRELLARIRAVLRRVEDRREGGAPDDVLRVHDLELSAKSRSVTVQGREIELTHVEFLTLETLLSCAGTLVTLDRLSAEVLGRRYTSFDRSLSVHMSNLRRKLGPYPDGGERIKTLRGEGFVYLLPRARS